MTKAASLITDAAGTECVLVEPGKIEPLIVAAEPIDEVAAREDGDTAVIANTSGTTGTPKGAELTHHNLLDAARVAVEVVDSGPESVALGPLPLFHVFGPSSGLDAMMGAGGCLTLVPRFEAAKALEIIGRSASRTGARWRGAPGCQPSVEPHPPQRPPTGAAPEP
jgi:long-chain acyl-CoA synthetase